jgi:hypothetical protein
VLIVGRDVLPETFDALRTCGEGRRECVVYWTGPIDAADTVDGIVQPPHEADWGWYEIDQPWLTRFFLELRAARRCVRAQIHTHPGAQTRHSPTDDGFAVAPHTGFVSIVLPHFAQGSVSLDGAYVAELAADGNWVEQPATSITWS